MALLLIIVDHLLDVVNIAFSDCPGEVQLHSSFSEFPSLLCAIFHFSDQEAVCNADEVAVISGWSTGAMNQ
ncbi:hypothetical protein NPIL_546001 [Nephila pilipes]|uniref:Spider venom protein n=1 Tax=Nephila pilipes TaxID=299642 RepID=A0A8X6N765_NEPPI|nr:hypothetical protein NPIL_546001 [Nephila pilipes]